MLISPSLTTSTSTSTYLATMPLTAASTSASSRPASTGSPFSLANMSLTDDEIRELEEPYTPRKPTGF